MNLPIHLMDLEINEAANDLYNRSLQIHLIKRILLVTSLQTHLTKKNLPIHLISRSFLSVRSLQIHLIKRILIVINLPIRLIKKNLPIPSPKRSLPIHSLQNLSLRWISQNLNQSHIFQRSIHSIKKNLLSILNLPIRSI